jgi:hypothetical protein
MTQLFWSHPNEERRASRKGREVRKGKKENGLRHRSGRSLIRKLCRQSSIAVRTFRPLREALTIF